MSLYTCRNQVGSGLKENPNQVWLGSRPYSRDCLEGTRLSVSTCSAVVEIIIIWEKNPSDRFQLMEDHCWSQVYEIFPFLTLYFTLERWSIVLWVMRSSAWGLIHIFVPRDMNSIIFDWYKIQTSVPLYHCWTHWTKESSELRPSRNSLLLHILGTMSGAYCG